MAASVQQAPDVAALPEQKETSTDDGLQVTDMDMVERDVHEAR